MKDKVIIFYHYNRCKFLQLKSKEALEIHQANSMARFQKKILLKAPFYQQLGINSLQDYPIVNRNIMMDNFDDMNTVAVKLDESMAVALKCEQDRDFVPQINGLTVGLSSGTSGKRGVFLASKQERLQWAGIILAKCLPRSIFNKTKIAFFLRANSNLYTTINSKNIQFKFFDLLFPFEQHLCELEKFMPEVLVAPAQVLKALAQCKLDQKIDIKPIKIISVAEVLTRKDKQIIEEAFKQPIHQIYQATEGFLASTCKYGNLHLNEKYIHFEKKWIDKEQTKFIPIISDFTRTSQIIWRYQLDDILVHNPNSCNCGSPETVVSKIEGRLGDTLVLLDDAGAKQPIFSDAIERVMTLASNKIEDYQIIQPETNLLEIQLKGRLNQNEIEHIENYLRKFLFASLPNLILKFTLLKDFAFDPTSKRRKIKNLSDMRLI